MAKRIYQVAKAFEVKGVEIVHYLRVQGFDVKSHMSPMTTEMFEAVEKKYKPAKPAAKKASAKKTAKKAAKKTAKKTTAKKAAKKTTAKKTAKKATKKATVKKAAAKAKPEAVREAAAEADDKKAVKVIKKSEQVVDKVAEKAAREAAAAEKDARDKKPRVIRYAPGMEPGARRSEVKTDARPAAAKEFQIRSQPQRRSGHPGQRTLTSARSTPTAQMGAPPQRGKRKRKKKVSADKLEIQRSVRQTMASLEKGGSGKRKRRALAPVETTDELSKVQESVLRILPLSTLAELANAMKVPETEVIATCLRNGLMVTINQRLEPADIEVIATEYEFEVEFVSEHEIGVEEDSVPTEDELEPRAPVVTVMGHVDHGKTKLLDFIRKANVADHEAGAITQHIGAYSVDLPGGKITFLDTPGHEAFTAMRARGTQVTDLVILVVAADDGVMPQTVEAIDHAKAAQVPLIVAINKMDLPTANSDRVKQELLQHGVTVEDFGGNTVALPISAKLGDGVDKLLEMVLLQAELLELKGAPRRPAKGSVVEAKKDPGRGVIFTVLVQQGTLKVGAPFNVGLHYGTVRALINEWGKRIEEVSPGTPVAIMGANGVPEAGDVFSVVESEVKAREISTKRMQLRREQEIRYQRRIGLDELYDQISKGEVRELRLVLKGDVAGSVEAMADNFQKLSTDEVRIAIIHKSVGTVNESDVLLAVASNAIIIGFNVRPQVSVRELAKREQVEIRTYDIIYEAVDDVKQAMSGLLPPEIKETVLGTAEVRQLFRVPRIGSVAGCYVTDGVIERNAQIRILRDGVVLSTRKISSLKRFKEDVGKVESGFECGISLEDFQDIKEGDTLEAFVTTEVARSI